ncbi:Uncharacterised protein [Neisseria meningitidis]|nr:hypothetical protein A6J49_05525 [Neisseria meningitidis]EJU79215.1 hypothetical protein NMEN3081_1366 [Neisseria meningitidis NM3081]ELK59223.1 hypothetical protein NMNM422_1257 [Neisseria meningitidis NM422]ELK79176.1 hypothetical protein NMM13255_1377 [Neisseria meningitidis M13255]ELK83305.1 hypothetical protein NMNM418_1290 [Neisseria meningitidis NM418]ELK96707.1 hypothetical protein NM9506_1192 [Neisseria meningitidis 9506]ELK97182.1 hypothetical protein NM9757_1236 [Neisseria menin
MPSEAGFAPNTALMREIPIKGCKNAVRTETWFRRHFKKHYNPGPPSELAMSLTAVTYIRLWLYCHTV